MSKEIVDYYVLHCDDIPDPVPAEDYYCDPEDFSFDDWLLDLANLYGGF